MPTKPKKKRFHRDLTVKERTNPYMKKKADAILATFSQHFYVSGKFMVGLFYDWSDRTVRDYIRYNYDMGYVVKMRTLSFTHSHIYKVTEVGLRYLKNNVPDATNLVRHKGTNIPDNYFHSLMMCQTTQNITVGVKKNGDTIRYISELLRLIKDPVDKPFTFPCKISFTFPKGLKTYSGHATPDNAINITYSKNNQSRLILIEAERESPAYRETFASGSCLRKILAYEDICLDKSTNPKIVKNTLQQCGRSNCHILFVYPTWAEAKAARDKMAIVLARRLPKSKRYLFGVQPTYDDETTDPKPDTSIYDKPLLRIGEPDICLKDLCDE